MAEAEDREEKLQKVQEKLEHLMSRENLQEDSFIQMNMDAQMQIPICILAGHEQFEQLQAVDVATLYDAALRSQSVLVDKANMQLKPVIKSKRNTVILHDLAEGIPLEELHELFDRCPAGEKLKTIKPDVNSTAFVTFEDDSAAQDAALWLRSQKLRDCPVKCSIKSEQFLRSFFPMQPVQSYGGPGVPAWASAWSSWAGADSEARRHAQIAYQAGWGYGGGKEGDVKGKSGPEKGGAFGGSGASGFEGEDQGYEKGKPAKGFKGKGKGKSKEGKSEVPISEVYQPPESSKAMGLSSHRAEDSEDESLGYQYDFRKYSRQQIIEVCSKMELVEKPESYKQIEEKHPDIALFSQVPNKDWAPLPTPLGSFMGSESRRTDESSDADGREEGRRKERTWASNRSSSADLEGARDWEWENWQDPSSGWSDSRRREEWYGRGRMQWVAKPKPGEEKPEAPDAPEAEAKRPSWAEK
ncbi:unnamed protein product, partial [Effrenium voratum]